MRLVGLSLRPSARLRMTIHWRDLHPLKSNAFHGALLRQLSPPLTWLGRPHDRNPQTASRNKSQITCQPAAGLD